MRKTYARWAVAVALAAGLASGGGELGAQAVNVSGRWIFDVTTDVGTGTPTVTLEQVGDSISGHYSSANLGEADLRGTVQGDKIAFTFSIDALGTPLNVTYRGHRRVGDLDAWNDGHRRPGRRDLYGDEAAGRASRARLIPPRLQREGRTHLRFITARSCRETRPRPAARSPELARRPTARRLAGAAR